MLFVPIYCVLDIIDNEKKKRFISGNGFDIIEELVMDSDEIRRYTLRLTNIPEDNTENYRASMEELKKIYEFGFSDDRSRGYYSGGLDIRTDLGKECLKICNSMLII